MWLEECILLCCLALCKLIKGTGGYILEVLFYVKSVKKGPKLELIFYLMRSSKITYSFLLILNACIYPFCIYVVNQYIFRNMYKMCFTCYKFNLSHILFLFNSEFRNTKIN